MAFVVLAALLGSAVGTTAMLDHEDENGESRQAQQIIDEAGIPAVAAEMVLVQSRDGTTRVDSPAFRAAVDDVRRSIEGTGEVQAVRTPYDATAPAPATADGASALVVFEMRGAAATAYERVDPVLDAVAGVQARHPTVLVEEAGRASADKTVGQSSADDFRRAEMLSLP
ncbi:MAG TPA: hypothetical protein VGP16_19320, partial [Asanoa sp.]|nr:hypothetical protein [Asanoa sp.]